MPAEVLVRSPELTRSPGQLPGVSGHLTIDIETALEKDPEKIEHEPKKIAIHYAIANLALAGPRFPQPLFWNATTLRRFLNESGYEDLDWTPIRMVYPLARQVRRERYHPLGSAQQSFRSEGRGRPHPVDLIRTGIDIVKHQQPLQALQAFVLMPHINNSPKTLKDIRQQRPGIPFAVYPHAEKSKAFTTPEQVEALGGSVLVQINAELIDAWGITDADHLREKLTEHGLSGAILDTALLQEPDVMEILSRRRDQDNNEPPTYQKAISNIFDTGILGSIPVIHAAFGRSDLSHRIVTTGDDLVSVREGADESTFATIMKSIGTHIRKKGGDYRVVVEPNPVDFQESLPKKTRRLFLDMNTVAQAFLDAKVQLHAWLAPRPPKSNKSK